MTSLKFVYAFHKALYRDHSRDTDEGDLFCCKFTKVGLCVCHWLAVTYLQFQIQICFLATSCLAMCVCSRTFSWYDRELLTCDLDLRTWLKWGHGELASKISTSEMTPFESYPHRQTDTHVCQKLLKYSLVWHKIIAKIKWCSFLTHSVYCEFAVGRGSTAVQRQNVKVVRTTTYCNIISFSCNFTTKPSTLYITCATA